MTSTPRDDLALEIVQRLARTLSDDREIARAVAAYPEHHNMDLSPASALTSARKDIRSLLVLFSPPKPYDDRHKYEPHKLYPWFCTHCGYPEHEKALHF